MEEELLKKFEPKPVLALDYERQLFQARFSPCGTCLAAAGYDAAIQRWQVASPAAGTGGPELTKLAPLTGHHGWTQCLEFHPQGNRLYTADSWGQLACWPYTEPAPAPVWSLPEAHNGWIRALAVSPDGLRVATGGNDTVVRVWSAADGTLERELPHPAKVFSLAFHPGGSLVSGDLRGAIRHWDLSTGTVVRELNAGVLYQLDKIQECGGVRHMAFDASGGRLACAGQKTPGGGFCSGFPCVLVFDWETGGLVQEMQVGANDDGFAYDARFHPQGFVMAVSCAFPGKGYVWFWTPGQPTPFYQSNAIPNGRSLSLHPDGRRLAILVSLSANGNGRQLQDGQYLGGNAKIHILEFPAA